MLRLFGTWSVILFLGGSGHLWYLGATAVAVTFLTICLYYKIKLKWMIFISCLFYTFGLMGDSYQGLIKSFVGNGILMYVYAAYDFIAGKSRNGLFMGYIFVLMGYLFSKGKVRVKRPVALAGFIVSLLCMCAEALWLEQNNIPADNNMYVFLLPTAFCMFAFVSSLSLKDHPIYEKLRTIGVLVYFLHMLVNKGIWAVKKVLFHFMGIDIQPVQFFVVLAVTILLASMIEWLSRKKRFNWLRWFIS